MFHLGLVVLPWVVKTARSLIRSGLGLNSDPVDPAEPVLHESPQDECETDLQISHLGLDCLQDPPPAKTVDGASENIQTEPPRSVAIGSQGNATTRIAAIRARISDCLPHNIIGMDTVVFCRAYHLEPLGVYGALILVPLVTKAAVRLTAVSWDLMSRGHHWLTQQNQRSLNQPETSVNHHQPKQTLKDNREKLNLASMSLFWAVSLCVSPPENERSMENIETDPNSPQRVSRRSGGIANVLSIAQARIADFFSMARARITAFLSPTPASTAGDTVNNAPGPPRANENTDNPGLLNYVKAVFFRLRRRMRIALPRVYDRVSAFFTRLLRCLYFLDWIYFGGR